MKALIYFFCMALLVCVSCNPFMLGVEEEQEVNIESHFVLGLNAGTTLRLLFSQDGKTFSPEKPTSIKMGSQLFVKVNNGTHDLTSADHNFDWSDSMPLPTAISSDHAEFTASIQDMTIGVYVTRK